MPRDALLDLDVEGLPDKVAQAVRKRQQCPAKLFTKEDESEEGDDVDKVEREELEDEISLRVLAGISKNLQSGFTTIENFIVYAELTLSLYAESSEESTALQAMHLSALQGNSNLPDTNTTNKHHISHKSCHHRLSTAYERRFATYGCFQGTT